MEDYRLQLEDQDITLVVPLKLSAHLVEIKFGSSSSIEKVIHRTQKLN